MENTKKRKNVSVADKMDIIRGLEGGKSNMSTCKGYGLSASTVSTIWKNREATRKAFEENKTKTKKMRTCQIPGLDEALFQWFKLKRSANLRWC